MHVLEAGWTTIDLTTLLPYNAETMGDPEPEVKPKK